MSMYAMNIQNDVISLVLRENCKSKQMTDFIAWPSRCHDTIYHIFDLLLKKLINILKYKYAFVIYDLVFLLLVRIKYNLYSNKQRIFDQYLQLHNAEIHESQMLKFFQEIYNMGQSPHYVNTLKNTNDRAAVCKFAYVHIL